MFMLKKSAFLTYCYYKNVRPTSEADSCNRKYHQELSVENAADSLSIFADNLHHSNRGIRVSTLKILCHHELLNCVYSTNDQLVEKKMKTEVSQTSLVDSQGNNVCFCLYYCCYCHLIPCCDLVTLG
jgi:hypothetical protein